MSKVLFFMSVCVAMSFFLALQLTVGGMFAPRRPKQRIYPTLKRLIETKGNLISRKVGRKIYRVLAVGLFFSLSFLIQKTLIR
jgi:hypothetical protein